MIALNEGDLRLVLDPAAGGTVVSFTHREQPILRAALPHSDDPRDRAAFPLVPFSGRIDRGRFKLDGHRVELPPNMPPEPHAIHGHGWQSSWQVTTQTARRASLELVHAAGAWPWDYLATQTFALQGNQLRVELTLTNNAPQPMPAGLGWHPYFPRDLSAELDDRAVRLRAPVRAFWPNSADTISLAPTVPDWLQDLEQGISIEKLNLDNAFSVAEPPVQPVSIHWVRTGIEVSLAASPNLGHLIIYTPPGEPYFCVEPVSHAPNCLNSSLESDLTGKRFLEPHETMSAEVVLTVSPAS